MNSTAIINPSGTKNIIRRTLHHFGLITANLEINWEMIALWSFVVFSFAALIYVVYDIGAKIDGNSPF